MDKQEDSPKPSTGKEFFTVHLSLVNEIVRQGAGANELAAYLVLARGAGKRMQSSWGANSIANHTGQTYHRAIESIDWLAEHGFICEPDFEPNQSKINKRVWEITPGEAKITSVDIALANALIDGIGAGKNNPPLERIDTQIEMGKYGLPAARLDALMVLVHLYSHQLMADYGGINPQAGVYKHWEAAEKLIDLNGSEIFDFEGTNLAFYEIQGGVLSVYVKFAKAALFYVTDDKERGDRFWWAFRSLKTLKLLYETTQIRSADPGKNKRAHPLYTLYVHDAHARESDPYLADTINQAIVEQIDPDYHGFSSGQYDPNVELFNGQFRYIANKKTGGFPIGIYRLRFRAHTRDTGKGMAAEQKRVDDWKKVISNPVRH